MTSPRLTLRSLTATPVSVPLKRPLGTSAQTIPNAPLLLLDLETEEGITGRAYSFCYLESVARALPILVSDLSRVLKGQKVAPRVLSQAVSRYFKLTGLQGPLLMVASAIDAAAWDALALAAELPLAEFLGAEVLPVPAYNSSGLGLMPAEKAADEAIELLENGFRAIKMRLGRASFADDLKAVRAVRKRLPDEVSLMTDFNQALTFAQAMERCPALDGEGIAWIEEPIRHDDYQHLKLLAQATRTPIQIGENFVGPQACAEAMGADASDLVMFDLDRIGGVTGWLHASGIAAGAKREVSSHLFPEVSAHLLAATSTAHFLEYVDWAEPLLQEPLRIEKGFAIAAGGAGNGLRWNADAVARFHVQ